jgi:hypothetical protein
MYLDYETLLIDKMTKADTVKRMQFDYTSVIFDVSSLLSGENETPSDAAVETYLMRLNKTKEYIRQQAKMVLKATVRDYLQNKNITDENGHPFTKWKHLTGFVQRNEESVWGKQVYDATYGGIFKNLDYAATMERTFMTNLKLQYRPNHHFTRNSAKLTQGSSIS